MNEKICQRCGKTYISKSIITDDIKESLLKMSNVLKGKDKRITDIIDLCPDCVESFRRWIRQVD